MGFSKYKIGKSKNSESVKQNEGIFNRLINTKSLIKDNRTEGIERNELQSALNKGEKNSQLKTFQTMINENSRSDIVLQLKRELYNVGTQEPDDLLNFHEDVDTGFGRGVENLEKKYGKSKWLKTNNLAGISANDNIIFVGHGNSSQIKTWDGAKDGNAFGDLLDNKGLNSSPVEIDLKSCETGKGFVQTLSNRLYHQHKIGNTVEGPTTRTSTTSTGEDRWLTVAANDEYTKLKGAIAYADRNGRYDPASGADDLPAAPTIPDKHVNFLYGYSAEQLKVILKELIENPASWSDVPLTKKVDPDLLVF